RRRPRTCPRGGPRPRIARATGAASARRHRTRPPGAGFERRRAARGHSTRRTEVDLALVRAYIGLGANLGDARATLTAAVAALGALPGARLRGVSRLYRTTPVGVTDQPDFLNAAVALDVPAGRDSATGAIALLVELKRLERESGRQPRGRWGPRELDLDLLL